MLSNYKKTIWILLTLGGVLFTANLVYPRLTACGAVFLVANVEVIDQETGKPISGATVILKRPACHAASAKCERPDSCGQHIFEVETQKEGKTALLASISAGWSTGLFGKSGTFDMSGCYEIVRVEAEGYTPFEAPLRELTDEGPRSIHNREPLDLQIRIQRLPAD